MVETLIAEQAASVLSKVAAPVIAGAALLALGFGLGHHQKTLEDARAQTAQLTRAVSQAQRAGAATASGDQKSAAAQAATSATTAANLQNVPIYVTHQADAQCVIGVGAVRLLDAAARDTIPAPAIGLQTADSGVALSDLVGDDIANAGAFHTLAERLKAWDDWYDAQAAIAAGKPAPSPAP